MIGSLIRDLFGIPNWWHEVRAWTDTCTFKSLNPLSLSPPSTPLTTSLPHTHHTPHTPHTHTHHTPSPPPFLPPLPPPLPPPPTTTHHPPPTPLLPKGKNPAPTGNWQIHLLASDLSEVLNIEIIDYLFSAARRLVRPARACVPIFRFSQVGHLHVGGAGQAG